MHTLDEIIRQLRQMAPDLRRKYPIRELGVFGSYVRGEQTDQSDLDVLVSLDDGIGLLGLAALQQDLSDALGIKVDLIVKDALKRRITATQEVTAVIDALPVISATIPDEGP